MTPHLNCLNETVQMRGHNICFYAELTKSFPIYHQLELCIILYFYLANFISICNGILCSVVMLQMSVTSYYFNMVQI